MKFEHKRLPSFLTTTFVENLVFLYCLTKSGSILDNIVLPADWAHIKKNIMRFLGRLIVTMFLVPSVGKGQVYEKVFDFTEARNAAGNKGSESVAPLIQDLDGNLYGTTKAGGVSGSGTVFRINPAGTLTTLVEFSPNIATKNGSDPEAPLLLGRDGNLYGTTSEGGANGFGTVFKMTHAGVLTTMVDFSGNGATNKGIRPTAGLVQADSGDFYGTTSSGGIHGFGTIFKMSRSGVLTTLVNFNGDPSNQGYFPRTALVLASDGNFYGTTSQGGSNDLGTLFRITPAGVLTSLVSLTGTDGSAKGSFPSASLILGNDGSLFGTTLFGGENNRGTVFKMTLDGEFTTLVEFTGSGATNRGAQLRSALVQGGDGNFYGTTQGEADGDGGTVFKMSPDGELTTLFEFGANGIPNGRRPVAALTQASNGVLYGVTPSSIFRISSQGTLTTLVTFTGNGISSIGSSPQVALVQTDDGNFFGTTAYGGAYGQGTIFKMTPAGTVSTLMNFSGSNPPNKGSFPKSPLLKGSDGNLYGVTQQGGADGGGTIYRVTPAGVLTTLVDGGIDINPAFSELEHSGLVEGADGNFYGTTPGMGSDFGPATDQHGRIFRMTPDGTLTTLVNFSGNGAINKGRIPSSNMIQGSDGNFYGTTRRGGTGDLGTVFKMTPEGALTTIVQFTGDSGTFKGSEPLGTLVEGIDGNIYGTTYTSGRILGPTNFEPAIINGNGTVFKISPQDGFSTLVEFTGNGQTNRGGAPVAGLIRSRDGNFYGTTRFGGAFGNGTAFKMTSDGTLETIWDFSGSEGGYPHGSLTESADGDLYGTSLVSDGDIYRFVVAGSPTAVTARVTPLDVSSALIEGKVNARGSSTSASLEYGTDGISFPNTVPLIVGAVGYQSKLVGTTLTGLTPGTIYHFRFRAANSMGTIISPVTSFSTLAAPVALSIPATNIGPTSAVLNGTVNARNFESSVIIEWGTDGNSFPNKVAATPATVMGNTPIPVSFSLSNQQPGQTFFYRIVASNAGGTATSGAQTYRTLIPATAAVTDATALSTTRAQVTGIVDAEGSSADVSFEYGTDGINFPNSFAATPSSVSGDSPIEVSATLTGLTQGTTYHVRIRAQGSGGTGLSAPSTLSLSILSGLVQLFPDPPPASNGTVTVNFSPPQIGAWRFTGDTKWLNSGVTSGNLAFGQRVIEFLPIPGFIRPPSETVDVTSSGNISLDRVYFETPVAASGSLTILLKPDEISAPTVPVAERTQWRIVGETLWRDSGGSPLTGLAAGSYLVECKPVSGRETPPTTSVSIGTDNSQDITLTYFTANTSVGSPALPLAFGDVSANEDLPFAYLGQIRTEVGSSTGFVVKRRVVATAGHVVFDDGTLSAVTGLQWFFQKHAGTHEPRPQIPRGYYLAAGYADQRILDDSPGEGSAQSQTLDYAALYFVEEAGRGGYGGYLASDSGDDNEFLTSTQQKILAGYPVDGIATADVGKLHATAPFTPALTPAFGETWTTTQVRGLGGISGGPLFVRHQGGSYFPAAIYLGGAGQTVVRAIDSDVVELFLRAEVSGNGGENNTGGGITHTSVAGNLNTTQTGSLRVVIEPAAANTMGAAWQLNPETTLRQGGSQKSGLSPGTYNLSFKTIAGFDAPATQPVAVTGGQLTTITFTYTQTSSQTPLETWRQLHFGPGATDTGDAADTEDPDKDGVKNIDEFTAGTDPNSSADMLKIGTATKSGSTFTAICAGKAGRIYTLQRNTGLTGMWTPLNSVGPLATNAPVSLADTSAPAGTSFYRIEVSMP